MFQSISNIVTKATRMFGQPAREMIIQPDTRAAAEDAAENAMWQRIFQEKQAELAEDQALWDQLSPAEQTEILTGFDQLEECGLAEIADFSDAPHYRQWIAQRH